MTQKLLAHKIVSKRQQTQLPSSDWHDGTKIGTKINQTCEDCLSALLQDSGRTAQFLSDSFTTFEWSIQEIVAIENIHFQTQNWIIK